MFRFDYYQSRRGLSTILTLIWLGSFLVGAGISWITSSSPNDEPIHATDEMLLAETANAIQPQNVEAKPVALSILENRCTRCHQGDQAEANLDLSHSGLWKLKGSPEFDSHALSNTVAEFVTHEDPELRMPLEGAPLSEEEVLELTDWLAQGMPELAEVNYASPSIPWSFHPINQPSLPQVEESRWSKNPIDRFIWSRAAETGLEDRFVERAPRDVLCRRLYLDVIGLPPSVDQLQEFLSNKNPMAYEQLVDQLLSSPHYGEKWGRHWLDLARYADSDGFENDAVRFHAWRYRDWVIEALNSNLPFDKFAIHQIAGDLIEHGDPQAILGTGFHRNTTVNRCPGIDTDLADYEKSIDRANTVATVFLALSLECAQCHDHKHDPITHQDYYRFFAFFESLGDYYWTSATEDSSESQIEQSYWRQETVDWLDEHNALEPFETWANSLRDYSANPNDDMAMHYQLLGLRNLVDRGQEVLLTEQEQRSQWEQWELIKFFLSHGHKVISDLEEGQRIQNLVDEFDDFSVKWKPPKTALVVKRLQNPKTTFRRIRGDFYREGEEVTPGIIAALPQIEKDIPNRLDLANWIVGEDNPLTARVMVNHIWGHYFGRGLVPTSGNFGSTGLPPSHPQLLDWLAGNFRSSGWDLKQLHRLILMSQAYQLVTSSSDPEIDQSNDYYLHQNRFRLSAEHIRDSMLSAAGLLNHQIGGPSIFPPQPRGVSTISQANRPWILSEGDQIYRRSLYIHYQRTSPYPSLSLFDFPSSNLSCPQREISNTPLQALCQLNDVTVMRSCQMLAMKVISHSKDEDDCLEFLYLTCLSRLPTAVERDEQRSLFSHPDLKKLNHLSLPLMKQATSLNEQEIRELIKWMLLTRVIFNTDEFLTRN